MRLLCVASYPVLNDRFLPKLPLFVVGKLEFVGQGQGLVRSDLVLKVRVSLLLLM